MKKYIIVIMSLIIIALIVLLIIFTNRRKSEELEAVQIFEKRATMQAFVEYSSENIDTIQKEIENLEYVKNVELVSKNDAFEMMQNRLGTDVMDGVNSDIFPNSFKITLDINSVEDFEKIKALEYNIESIDGIDRVEVAGCNEIIEVYKKTGIKGMREYNTIFTIMSEKGLDEVESYLEEHEETRELLKDFIHF